MNRNILNLECLPAEVILNVASCLNSHQAGALRRTCKHLATLASGPVFASITISLQKSVLSEFKKFAAKPYIGPNIETVVVTPTRYQSLTLYCWVDENLSGGAHKLWSSRSQYIGDHNIEVVLEFLVNSDVEEFLEDARRAREQWQEEGKPDFDEEEEQAWTSLPRRLKEAVKDAKERRHREQEATFEGMAGVLKLIPNLQHVKFYNNPTSIYGNIPGDDPWDHNEFCLKVPHIFLHHLESLAISPKRLSVEGKDHHLFPFDMFNGLSCIRNRLIASESTPLLNLRYLKLTGLCDLHCDSFDRLTPLFTSSGLAHLISCAPLLEVLEFEVSLNSPTMLDLDDLVTFQNPLQRLRKVLFSNFEIGCANLSQWLEQSRDTLQHIRLQNLRLKNDHLASFLDLMRVTRYTRLKSLSIETCMTVGQQNLEHKGASIRVDALSRWTYEPKFSHELVDYVTGKTEKNPWFVRYVTLFPHLWEHQQDSGDATA